MKVKVRAVIIHDGCIGVVAERRGGAHSHWSLPGGNVNPYEPATIALVREVEEEAGIAVTPGQLLYVTEALAPHTRHDLNLVFLAEPDDWDDHGTLRFVDPRTQRDPSILPPLLDEIARDLDRGWSDNPRWLGNLWSSELRPRPLSPD